MEVLADNTVTVRGRTSDAAVRRNIETLEQIIANLLLSVGVETIGVKMGRPVWHGRPC